MLRPLEEISKKQKIEAFDELYSFILEELQTMERKERSKDFEHYVFETAMEVCADASSFDTDDLWDYYSEISEGYNE